jgi:hypothetical protein
MNWFIFAPKFTLLEDVTSNQAIENGEPVRVWGLVITNEGAGLELEIRTGDGNTLLGTINVRANDVLVSDIKFVADKGLSFTGSASVSSILVWHSHPGS